MPARKSNASRISFSPSAHNSAPGIDSAVIRVRRGRVLVSCGVLALVTCGSIGARPLQVRDAIEMTRLVDPEASEANGDAKIQVSPDGARFFIVTRAGDLINNANLYRIVVFKNSDDSLQGVSQFATLDVASSGNAPGVGSAEWVGDRRIAFLGAYGRSAARVYLWEPGSSLGPAALTTTADGRVAAFRVAEDGTVLYATQRESPSDEELRALKEAGFPVGGDDALGDLASGQWAHPPNTRRYQLAFKRGTGTNAANLLADTMLEPGCCFSLSPDSRYGIVLEILSVIPARWKLYQEHNLRERISRLQPLGADTLSDPGEYAGLSQLVLFDLDSGRERPLLDAPMGFNASFPQILWLKSRHSVVVSNVMLPPGARSAAAADALRYPAVVEVNLQTGAVRPLLLLRSALDVVTALTWDEQAGVLSLQRSQGAFNAAPTSRLKATAQGWRTTASGSRVGRISGTLLHGNIAIQLRQSLHTPPDIFAVELASGRQRRLTTLNPQFAALEFGKVEEIAWTDHDGWRRTGGLVYPTHYQAGTRYPLVIQTHGFNHNAFLIDGPFDFYTGFAAQALANRGFFVAQIEGPIEGGGWPGAETEKEGPIEMGAYLELISQLGQRGLIDPARVGLQGFSRTAYHVKYALAFSGFHFKAASDADGIDFGYLQTLESTSREGDWGREFEGVYAGALPVGAGLKVYLQRAPDFQADKIDTPLRSEAIGPDSAIGEWELYSLLTLRHVPTEMFFYPDGVHELQKPQEQFNSQSGNVDWFDFWINGHEDPSSEKREQYQRWRKLKSNWGG